MTNLILNTDSYKASHYLQYPPKTTHISSYVEARRGAYDNILFFGLQMFIKQYLQTPITTADIDEAEEFLAAHGLPFNREGWEGILTKHHGLLPLSIEAVAEGSLIPMHNALVQVTNTDPDYPWLTSYIETALLRAVWYPSTVATISWHCKQIIKQYLEKTADDLSGLPFKLHDFGARGASSLETAGLGGAAHMVNFLGTDTIEGILNCRRFYHETMAGFSIPAAEHSTITSWGKEHEVDAYANMLEQFAGEGKIVAVVSDSYDLWHAIDQLWGEELKTQVQEQGGTVVIRPDSGDPVTIVPEVLTRLMQQFGHEVNSKGYKVLPSYIRVIQGDGIASPQVVEQILAAMEEQGLSADSIAFGMGGGLLQKVHRDTLGFAMKTSAIQIGDQWQDVFKDPVTDPSKRSKRGRLALINSDDGISTIRLDELAGRENLLLPVCENGKLLHDWTLAEVRQRAAREL